MLEDWSDEQAEQFVNEHLVVLQRNASEFPFGLSFQEQGDEHELWLRGAAGHLSVTLNCATLYTGNPFEPDNPFYCIVFESGRAYLADDEGSTLAEGEGGPVTIIRRAPELDVARA